MWVDCQLSFAQQQRHQLPGGAGESTLCHALSTSSALCFPNFHNVRSCARALSILAVHVLRAPHGLVRSTDLFVKVRLVTVIARLATGCSFESLSAQMLGGYCHNVQKQINLHTSSHTFRGAAACSTAMHTATAALAWTVCATRTQHGPSSTSFATSTSLTSWKSAGHTVRSTWSSLQLLSKR